MKTKILFTLMIALFALGGCKTVKQTKTAKQTTTTDVTVNQSSEQRNDIKLKVDSSKMTVDKGHVSELITEETVTVVYAPRDSNGKQAVISVTTTKRGIDRSEAKNLQENKKNKSDLHDNSDYKSESADKSKTKSADNSKVVSTTETPTPGWVYVVILVVAVIVAGGGYLILKRYNIIK